MDGLIEEGEYDVQRRLLQGSIEALVIPEVDATLHAGELLESLGSIWGKATLEERHRLLSRMLDAVYIDLLTNRSIIGLLPKPAFYSLFESLRQMPDSNVIIFNPDNPNEPGPGDQKENALGYPERVVGLVETGESRTPRPEEAVQDMLQA